MSTNLYPGQPVIVQDQEGTDTSGRLLGTFTRKGERWWTVHWENGDTTAEREDEIK